MAGLEMLTSSEGRPEKYGKSLDTWTCSCNQLQSRNTGMAGLEMLTSSQGRPEKYGKSLDTLDMFVQSITIAKYWHGPIGDADVI
jgi:hypothetical protein